MGHAAVLPSSALPSPSDAAPPTLPRPPTRYRLGSHGGALADGELARAAALLHSQRGQHEEALRLLLTLQDPGAFDYVSGHALLHLLASHVAGALAYPPSPPTVCTQVAL